ncbi:coiled-coil domain-containing protein 27 [Rhinolophus ferrumequinum]|uniref:coiled-coil domain-containing protein 27 n=1 Tax=Rhinolophus ferrumequinum TaxID=59479 RepID=UPI00140FC920|nr:coiled-coil domain-containing protein 27 [Rhinolophus ferrumequinum]
MLDLRRPQKPNLLPSLMDKGLMALRRVANRDCRAQELKQCSLSSPAEAVNLYYRRLNGLEQEAGLEDRSFAQEMEELRKVFLRRPGCPQFCSRSTSMSHYGSATTVSLPEELCTCSEARKMTENSLCNQHGLDTQVDGRLLSLSKSACEFNYLGDRSESPVSSSPVLACSHLRKRIPWYMLVIHEKVQRLSALEDQVQKKDEEILALQEEREVLKKELKYLLSSKGQGTLVCPGMKERPPESASKPFVKLSLLKAFCRDNEELQRWRQMQEEYAMVDRDRDLEGDFEEEDGLEGEPESEEGAQGGVGRKGSLQEAGAMELEEDMELEEEMEQEAEGYKHGSRRRTFSLDELFEEELMAQLEEYERVIQEVQFGLEDTRRENSLATGAITSLQRQIDFQESQLQKMNAENELLQKELRERNRQLQAMSDKFSNLREDKKHQEVMGLIEKDNIVLRQQVWELEQELTKQKHTISESKAKINYLQAQLNQSEKHLQGQKQLEGEMQGKMELVQYSEQQARVALESAQSRLERLRNKIIQATFSISGIKPSAIEISDNDVLEALQRIIAERTDYYNQLKQKGVKVPPLPELLSSPSKSRKLAPSK